MFTLFHELLALMGKGLSFFYDLIPSYGLAIILLTVAVRLVMLPLTIKQTRSMQEMQKLQPEVKRLQAKYKGGDRQKMNEEMMKLYKEHKVNPLGGCLPLLLQLPIFLALYRVFAGCGAHLLPKGKACPTAMVGTKYLPGGSALTKAINAGKAGFLGMNLGLAPMAALRAAGSFPGSIVHVLPYFLLILFFTYFYVSITFNPTEVADNMKKYGGFVPGIRPGKRTAEYIDTILTRITLAGAIYLALIALLPNFLISGFKVAPLPWVGDWLDANLPKFITEGMNVPFFFGGTSLLIVVGVAMDTVQQVESQLIMRHYDGFMKKTRIRGRRA